MARILTAGHAVGSFSIEKELNRGMMAISYAATDHRGERVFLKQYKSPSIRTDWYHGFISYQRELRTRIESGSCRSFCYRFLDAFEHERCYFQAFEFLDRSHSLQQLLDSLHKNPNYVAPGQRLIMAKVLTAGIHTLHSAKIVHSDLKPDNVMLIRDEAIVAGYRLRIIDMDFSVLTDQVAPWHGKEGTGYFGTPGYLSPEHTRGTVPQEASDVFTLGLMLHELLGGSHPYRSGDEDTDTKSALSHGAQPIRLVGDLATLPNAAEIVETVHHCLSPNPGQRPSALEVNQVLNNRSRGPRRRPTKATDVPVRGAPRNSPPLSTAPLERIVLRSATGEERAFNVDTQVGRALLRSLGTDAKYVDELQFSLARGSDGWSVFPNLSAMNETLLNGRRLRSGMVLAAGDVLGVGSEERGIVKLPLTVRLGE